MQSSKTLLLSTTMVPFVIAAGVAVGGAVLTGHVALSPAYAACNPCNPCAAAKACNPWGSCRWFGVANTTT